MHRAFDLFVNHPVRATVFVIGLLAVGCGGCGKESRNRESTATEPPPTGSIDLPGVDLAELTREEKRVLFAVVREELDPCGSPESLARVLQDSRCRRAPFAVRYILELVKQDMSAQEVSDRYVRRYGAQAVRRLQTAGAPSAGGDMAVVTIVEFSDFECPFCGQTAPVLKELLRRHEGRVRLVFKNFPLSLHESSELAARAALAAHRQGKFWPMHDLMFANQSSLGRHDLQRYAEQLGLDLARFGRDLDSEEIAQAVQADYREGESVGVVGTPTFFVNGRAVDGGPETLDSYIQEELEQR